MNGQLDILNCGAGHLELRFDRKNRKEIERAKRIITDMLKRGYALFIHGKEDALVRVKRFDAKQGLYLVDDGPLVGQLGRKPHGNRGRIRTVPMTKAKATVVGRSAGG